MDSKRKYTFGLLSLVSMLWVLLYPAHPFPGGIDARRYHILSNTIIYHGNIEWMMHPFSAWGFYPFSYEPGTSILLAGGTLLTGLNHLNIVLLLNYLLGTLATVTMFAILLKIKRDLRFVLMGTFIFTIAPRIIAYLNFVSEARGFFIVLVPTFLLISILYFKKRDRMPRIFMVLMFLVIFTLSIIHKNFLFLIPFIGALIVIVVLDDLNFYEKTRGIKDDKIYRYVNSRRSKAIFWIGLVGIIISSLFAIAKFAPTRRFNAAKFEQGGFISGRGSLGTLANIGISMTGGVGVGFVLFGILGFIIAVSKERKRPIESLFILSFVASMPLVLTSVYFRPFFVIYASIFSAYGFLWIVRKDIPLKKYLITGVLVFLIVSSVFFTNYMVSRWQTNISRNNTEGTEVDGSYHITFQTYNAGMYGKYNFVRGQRYVSYRQQLVSQRIELVSTQSRYGSWWSIDEIEKLSEGEGDYWKVKRTGDLANPHEPIPPVDEMYPDFFKGDRDFTRALAKKHNITTVHTHPDEDESDKNIRYLYNTRYKIYENDENVFWSY